MSGFSPPSVRTPARRRLRAVFVVAALLVAAAWASLTRVPPGHIAFRRTAWASSYAVLKPGFHLCLPGIQQLHVLSDSITVHEKIPVPTREGAKVEVDYSVSLHLAREVAGEAASRGLLPEEMISREAQRLLAQAVGTLAGDELVAGTADDRLIAALREGLSREGLTPDSVLAATSVPGAAPVARRSLGRPIVIIGLDGADWEIADPLIQAGKLPNLAKLRRNARWGYLRSSSPMLSPLLWTTAATGKTPDEHGIVDFLVRDPKTGEKVPITSSFRRVPALWNIFSGRGLTSAFIAWWATYPAEAIRGEIVSDRVAYSLFDVDALSSSGRGLVYPPGLWSKVKRRLVSPSSLTDDEVTRIANVTPAEIAEARGELERHQEKTSRNRLVHLMKILASTKTYQQITLDVIANGQPDLLGVYYEGIDEVSHRTAHCVPPALPFCTPADAKRYGGTINAFYGYQDELLGQILAAIDPNSYVIVMSDHGFRHGGDRPRDVPPDIEGKPGKWHRQYGIALVSGPGIQSGNLDNVTLLDITPTVLKLAGLPAAKDMPGRALVSPGGAPEQPPAIASYTFEETSPAGREVASASTSNAGQDEMLENLRSLGYIGGGESEHAVQDPAASAPGGTTPGTLTSHTNLGALHLQKGEIDLAAKEFEAALKINPIFFPALVGLSQIREQQGNKQEALDLAERAMTQSRSPEPSIYLRYAGLMADLGSTAEARQTLQRIRAEKPKVAEIPTALAVLAHKESRDADAEKLLKEALEIDPANAEAITRLNWLKRRQGDELSLEPYVRKALQVNPASVLHHNLLGLILEKKGDAAGAEKEFKKALGIAPDFGGTMANLGSLYGRTGRLQEAVKVLSRALEIQPDNLECRVNLGAALGKLGRTDDAIKVLEQGRHGDHASPELLNALAVGYANKGEMERAEKLLRQSLEMRPEQPQVRSMLRQLHESG